MEKMLQTEIWTVSQTKDGGAVLLRPHNTDIVIPVFIGRLESQSVLIGKEGVNLPRPLTHDLFLSLLRSQKLSLERVEVHEIIESTFHARLVITGGTYTGEAPLILDSRPSDAFALAVRSKCPILVSHDVVNQAGISFELILDALEDLDITDFSFGSSVVSAVNRSSNQSSNRSSGSRESARSKKLRMLQYQLDEAVAKEEYERAAKIRDMMKEMEDTDGKL